MTDCPNAEMRDRLPDLLHEQLDESARAAVLAHVGDCADCRAELALLRQTRVSLSSGIVAVDTGAIVRMVVARTAEAPAAARRHRWADWRLAAAIAVIAVGGASFAALHTRRPPNEPRAAAGPFVPGSAQEIGTAPRAQSPPPASARAPGREERSPRAGAELAAAGEVSDLSDSDLRTLLSDLDTMEAVPPAEPEPVTVRVSLPERGGTE